MNANHADECCDLDMLRGAIAETLDASSEAQLADHLATCDRCRDRIESFAGDETFWSQVTTHLAAASEVESETDVELCSSVFVKVDPDSPSLSAIEQHPFEAPLHPEILGRLDGFSIEQKLGHGGMGVVYKGFDAELNRPVAIKFLAPHLASNGVARKRFAREAQAAAAVVHPNVVPIYSIGASDKRPYLVMALISGRSLQKHVEEHGPLPAEDVVRIAQQIAAGLAAAHEQGLVHRDIKPANIMLEKDVSRVLITDFGLARAADDAGLTQSGWLAGTPHYMSPEQTMGGDVDHRSDLFSLGSVMYFMATGREPFRSSNPYGVLQKIGSQNPASARSINSGVPKMLDMFIAKLLSKNPEDRFEAAAAVQEALTQYLAYLQNPTQHAKPEFSVEPKRLVRRRFAFPLAGIALVSIAMWIVAGNSLVPFWSGKTKTIDTVSSGKPAMPNGISAPSFAASSIATPTPPMWITDMSAAQRWRQEFQELQSSVERMEQPISRKVRLNERFEFEKSQLLDAIAEMEKSLGVRNQE